MTKMLIDRAVVEQALEALEESLYATTDKSQFLAFEAITTLRAALVESVQEVDAERKRLLSIAKRRADHEASAAVHHAGRWHAAHEHHLTRHAAMRDLIAAMEESVQEPVTRLFGTLPVYDTPPQRPAERAHKIGGEA